MARLSPLDLMALWPDTVGQWQDMGAIAIVGPRPDCAEQFQLGLAGGELVGAGQPRSVRLGRVVPDLRARLAQEPRGAGGSSRSLGSGNATGITRTG